ncbi:flagellar biosynthesis anti-sigma factor FlgM [Blastomonas sp.]|uniref:flagellar biosynthesis anti-sigma factor FlgM n=1 Tax=Blastomonas sp. TaxID=1909299 RepID=UPI003593EF77
MSRISAYGSPAVGTTRQGGSTDKIVGAAATSTASDNNVRNAPAASFMQSAATSAPIDEGRVAAIRDALANGSYVIDTEKLAARMIALDLGQLTA